MSNNKGMTLIEIIVAIALLGIISIGLLTALSNNFSLITKTKAITEEVFQAQQEMELQIEEVKTDIKSGHPPTAQTYILFNGSHQRTVKGYPREVIIKNSLGETGSNNNKIYTIVADERMPQFDVATATNATITLMTPGGPVPHAYTQTPNLSVKSTATISDPKNVNLLNLHHWYASREGFNIPMVDNPSELEEGNKYPRFPEDYIIIPSATGTTLNTILPNYAGRHIIYTITPAAKSGRMGATLPSNSVFLSGLPVVNSNLRLHLDASMISKDDTSAIRTSGTDVYVKKWGDLSGGNPNNATQNYTDRQPLLIEENFGTFQNSYGTQYETYAKFLRFNGGQSLSIGHHSSLNLNDLTVFVVARSAATTSPKSIVSKYGDSSSGNHTWRLGWNEANQLGFYLKGKYYEAHGNAYEDINSISGGVGEGLGGEWHVLSGSSDLSFRVDKGTINTIPRSISNHITNNQPITIGWDPQNYYSTVDIAEIIIYNGILSESDSSKVEDYLVKKYKPVAPLVNIDSLNPITTSVLLGANYTMPSTVTANMSNGTIHNTPVNWHPTAIDTTSVGIKTSIGAALLDNSKTTTLTVRVLTINSLEDTTGTAEKGQYYPLPTTVKATLSDGSTQYVAVNWEANEVDTSTFGAKTINGAASLDSSKKVTLTIEIIPITVKGVSLNKTVTDLPKDTSESLVATIIPTNASNKALNWQSSNPSIVSVNNGVIVGVSKGTATVTVTTVNGGYSASCIVTVSDPVTVVGYEVDNIQPGSEYYGLKRNISADIYVLLSDGTRHRHYVSKSEWFISGYPTITETITGTAIAESTGEEVQYSINITVSAP